MGLSAESFVARPLEDWTQNAVMLNGKDQFLTLANAELVKSYTYKLGDKTQTIPGNEMASPDIATSNLLIEAYFQTEPNHGASVIVSKLAESGYQLAINKAGGPMRRPLKPYSADDQTSPDAAVTAAQKLMSLNHVVGILGTWSSAVTLAVLPLTLQAGIIEMNTSGAPDITSPKYRRLVFRTQPTDRPYGVSMARYAKQKGYAKVSMLVLNNPYALALRDSFNLEWGKLRMSAATIVIYNPSASSYAGEVQQALASKPDLLIVAGYTPDASIIVKEWYASDVKNHVMGPGFAFNEAFVKNVGVTVANGLLAVDGIPPIGTQGFKAFAEAYQAATGSDLADSFWPAQIHDQVNILALAIEAAQSTKGDDIAAKVRDVSNPPGTEVYDYASGARLLRQRKKINYQGDPGPCEFDETHNSVSDFAVW